MLISMYSFLNLGLTLLSNLLHFHVNIFYIGGAMGYISGFQTMLEPIMCVLGYSNDFSGLCGALVFVSGILVVGLVPPLPTCCQPTA